MLTRSRSGYHFVLNQKEKVMHDKAIPLITGTLHKVACTEVQLEILPNGTVRIIALEGIEPFAKFVVYPRIVVVNNMAVSKLEVMEIVKADPGDELPI